MQDHPDLCHPSGGIEVNVAEQLDTEGAFKFWRLNRPNAARLLKEIVFRWRGASAFVPGKAGKWVVWPRERWMEWTGLSRNQLDRALRELEDCGLIERENHRFAGREVRAFLRPTQLARKYLDKANLAKSDAALADGKGQEQQKVTFVGQAKPVHKKTSDAPSSVITEKTNEKTKEKPDYTSIPFSSKKATPLSSTSSPTAHPKQMKGSAGDDDEWEEIVKASNAKKQKISDKKYPPKQGEHQKKVKHPSELFPNWLSFSTEVQGKLYAKYLLYVDNFYKGKKGKGYSVSTLDDWTDEDDEALIAANPPPSKLKTQG